MAAELTLTDVARALSVSPPTLRRWVADGIVPLRDGVWTPAALAQARIVARMRQRGHSLEQLRVAAKELREVIDKIFTLMDTDPEMGPKLHEADTPQRFEFSDFDLVVNIRATSGDEDGNLHWEWSDDVDWKSKVQMTMSSEVANRYFQGKENVPVAVARRRIKTGGDLKAALALIPITKPIYEQYRAYVESEKPHLKV